MTLEVSNMKTLFIVFLAFSAVTAENMCTPGASFKMDCNACICSSDGKRAACTDMVCPEGNANVNDIDTVQAPETFICKPESYFWDDCNMCFCLPDGKSAACTDMICPQEPKNNTNTAEKQPLCEPGKQFELDDCSSCICNADGTTAKCTLGFCAYSKKRIASRKSQYCDPGKLFSPDNCNLCKCSNDGTKAMCTMKLCEERKARSTNDQYCEPGRMFSPDNCNLCKCSSDGTKAMCTMKLCPETEEPKPICKPRSQFNDYCNVCSCSDDGLSYSCTKMHCDQDLWNKDGSLKVFAKIRSSVEAGAKQICTPNSRFQEDCNTCACSSDGLNKACTFMSCDGNVLDRGNELTSAKMCQPGKAYSPDGCNTCICNRYGTEAACTLRLCLPSLKSAYKNDETENWGPLYKEGDACTPGKAFYSECNRCVCTGSGRSAFCTLMSCQTSP